MGLFQSVEERAAEQALELAHRLRLPAVARSRPTDEVRGKGCVLGVILILLAMVAATMIVAVLAGLDGGLRGAIGLALVLALAIFSASTLRRAWKARPVDYVDPELVVEAGLDGVTLIGPGIRHMLPYRGMRPRILSFAMRQSVRFLGIELDSPLGMIKLDDVLFVNGRNTAAAILRAAGRSRAPVAPGRR